MVTLRMRMPMSMYVFNTFFPGIRTLYRGFGCLCFDAADQTFSGIESQEGMMQGCVLASKLHSIGTLPIIGPAMLKHRNVLACLFPDNTSLVPRLSKTHPSPGNWCFLSPKLLLNCNHTIVSYKCSHTAHMSRRPSYCMIWLFNTPQNSFLGLKMALSSWAFLWTLTSLY